MHEVVVLSQDHTCSLCPKMSWKQLVWTYFQLLEHHTRALSKALRIALYNTLWPFDTAILISHTFSCTAKFSTTKSSCGYAGFPQYSPLNTAEPVLSNWPWDTPSSLLLLHSSFHGVVHLFFSWDKLHIQFPCHLGSHIFYLFLSSACWICVCSNRGMTARDWGFLTCTQVLMHAIPHGGYANTGTESALTADSGSRRGILAEVGNWTCISTVLHLLLNQRSHTLAPRTP